MYKSQCNICYKTVLSSTPKLFINCVKCKKAYLARINKDLNSDYVTKDIASQKFNNNRFNQ